MDVTSSGSLKRPGANARRAAELYGRDAETVVADSWRKRGFDVLARRLRTGAGELDLVVADAGMLLFIEVKARGSRGAARYAVQPRQQHRLLAAAEAAMAANQAWLRPQTRFDVVFVDDAGMEHIEDAIRYN